MKCHNVRGGTRKTASHRRKELALALCVSLWMAGGSVAWAGEVYINVDTNTRLGDQEYIPSGANITPAYDALAADKTLTITGGDWGGTWTIYGGLSRWSSLGIKKEVVGYTLNLTDVEYVSNVYGGWTDSDVADHKDATGNTVKLTNSKTAAGIVYGGYSEYGTATGNTVIIVNDSLPDTAYVSQVYGGYGIRKTTGNTVNLTNAYVGNVYGGSATDYSGNTLYLSGTNTVGGEVRSFETINIGKSIDENGNLVSAPVTWGNPVLKLTSNNNPDGILENPEDGTKATIDASALTFVNPETIANGATMNLIACVRNDGAPSGATITANLAPTTTALQEYSLTPVTGVLVNAAFQGQLSIPDDKKALVCTASNKATKLTFTDVEWKDSGALLDHAATLTNISFNGADVDTTNIHFTNIESLEANKKMTLVSSFGDTVGTITGEKYTVGTTLEGKGKASLSGSDLIFTAEPDSEGGGGESGFKAQEQTHNAVMGAEVGMAALSAGNDFVGAATEGLALSANVGADGVSSFAQMGGGSMRQETGSHIDVHAWNAIIALGHQNKQECGTTEYGAFFEYGTGNYSTFNGDERGDGSTRYTGGGLLAKYKRANGFYVEGSLRAGSVHDDARNVLRDVRTRVPYSYTTNAPYFGFHLGVGKEIAVAGGNTVDVYGKYFFNRRNSVSFDVGAGDHYDLDAVTSSVLRVGARYVMKREKWNFYGGVAYEYEMDGEAAGTASNGGASAAIRGADIGGGSFRGEIGATMTPGDNSPWKLDLNVTGFAGKKQGFTGGVSVAFMF